MGVESASKVGLFGGILRSLTKVPCVCRSNLPTCLTSYDLLHDDIRETMGHVLPNSSRSDRIFRLRGGREQRAFAMRQARSEQYLLLWALVQTGNAPCRQRG